MSKKFGTSLFEIDPPIFYTCQWEMSARNFLASGENVGPPLQKSNDKDKAFFADALLQTRKRSEPKQ